MGRIRWVIAAVALTSSLLLSGCSDSDMRDLAGFARMWAESHGLVDSNGKPDYFNIGLRAMGGSTGDEQADAVIDAGMTVKKFNDAEKLRDEGVKEKNLKKIDAAIASRPKEFRYHNDKGAILLEQGQVNEAYDEFDKADAIAKPYGTASQIRNIDSRLEALKRIPPPYHNSRNWAEQQYFLYKKRYELSKDPADLSSANHINTGIEKGMYVSYP